MARTKTSFTKETASKAGKASRRGKTKEAIVLEAFKEKAYLGLGKNATPDDLKRAMVSHLMEQYLYADQDKGFYLRLLVDMYFPKHKQTLEPVNFTFDPSHTPTQQMEAILKEVSEGSIAPDVGEVLVKMVHDSVKIEEYTELKAKILQVADKMGIEING